MRIKPGEIGKFKSLKQADAYKRAMDIKGEVETVAADMRYLDDISGIDFNDRVSGNVKIKDYERGYADGLETKTTGSLEYNAETGEVENFKAEQYRSMSGLPGWKGIAGCFISGTFKFEQNTEKSFWTGKKREVYTQKTFGTTEKVIVDKETGVIDYKKYNFGIPKLF